MRGAENISSGYIVARRKRLKITFDTIPPATPTIMPTTLQAPD